MNEVWFSVVGAIAAAVATVIVARMNSRSAQRQSTLATYEQLVEQVEDQQAQITQLFGQLTELHRRVVELETADAAWQAWADDLNLRWSVHRLNDNPPGYPTPKRGLR